MSAFVCNDYHLSLLAEYAALHQLGGVLAVSDYRFARTDAEAIGRILHRENVESVNYRYRENENPEYRHDESAGFNARASQITQIIKAADCLAYQSCEHDQWRESRAREIVDRIVRHATSRMPGYEQAEWEVQKPAPDMQRKLFL